MTSLTQRRQIMALITEAVTAGARQARACEAINLSARTLQRWRRAPEQGDGRPTRVQRPCNRLSDAERDRILRVVNSSEYGHLPASQIVPRLADTGVYLASESTIYRLMRTAGQLVHRTPDRTPGPVHRPRALTATAPGQLFSWDITYLPATVRGQYYYLYLFLDLFSRHIVGWQVYDTEDSARASELLKKASAFFARELK
ncbi:DDE-type integrase/transposase/recombinase [Castellaniella sp. WN]